MFEVNLERALKYMGVRDPVVVHVGTDAEVPDLVQLLGWRKDVGGETLAVHNYNEVLHVHTIVFNADAFRRNPGYSVEETALHEAVHALQSELHGNAMLERWAATHPYETMPHEVEARRVAAGLRGKGLVDVKDAYPVKPLANLRGRLGGRTTVQRASQHLLAGDEVLVTMYGPEPSRPFGVQGVVRRVHGEAADVQFRVGPHEEGLWRRLMPDHPPRAGEVFTVPGVDITHIRAHPAAATPTGGFARAAMAARDAFWEAFEREYPGDLRPLDPYVARRFEAESRQTALLRIR